MDDAPSVPQLPTDEKPTAVHIWTRRFVCLTLAILGLGTIGKLGTQLISEVAQLSGELAGARDREPVGYPGISQEQPEFKPPSCIREVDGRVYLWAGSGVKDRQAGWFDVSATDLPLKQFIYAFGRDKIRTIDFPILENPSDVVARRIYPERPVLGLVVGGEARAYPLTVMEKCEVVNDEIAGKSLAITYLPLRKTAAIYDRTLDGEVVSLGTSGYVYDNAFVLYDRRTDSLWWPKDEGLTAITGPLTGKVLKRSPESLERTAWGKWQRRHPATQVVVGADRSRGIPLPPPDEVASTSL